jgi:hypothetical protein
MSHILDRFVASARSASRKTFRVRTRIELFALQLARKLNDLESVHAYVLLAEQHSEEHLLHVYRRILKHSPAPGNLASSFHVELKRSREKGEPWIN